MSFRKILTILDQKFDAFSHNVFVFCRTHSPFWAVMAFCLFAIMFSTMNKAHSAEAPSKGLEDLYHDMQHYCEDKPIFQLFDDLMVVNSTGFSPERLPLTQALKPAFQKNAPLKVHKALLNLQRSFHAIHAATPQALLIAMAHSVNVKTCAFTLTISMQQLEGDMAILLSHMLGAVPDEGEIMVANELLEDIRALQ